jgi:hypothetical protein
MLALWSCVATMVMYVDDRRAEVRIKMEEDSPYGGAKA